MKKIVIIIILFSFVFILLAYSDDNINATTDDGRKVLLISDGTWIFQETDKLPLSLESFYVEGRDVDTNASRYSKDAVLTLVVKNETEKTIIAYRILIEIRNSFGEIMNKIRLTSGDSNIEPAENETAKFIFDDNQFIDNEVYDNLVAYNIKNLKIIIIEAIAIYAE